MVLEPISFIATFVAGSLFTLFFTLVVIDIEKITAQNKHYRDLIEKIADKLDVK